MNTKTRIKIILVASIVLALFFLALVAHAALLSPNRPGGLLSPLDLSSLAVTVSSLIASGSATSTITSDGTTSTIGGPLIVAGNLTLQNGTTSAQIPSVFLTAGSCTSTQATISGASTSSTVIATPQNYPGDGIYWHPFVTSTNIIVVKQCAAAAATSTATSYNIRLIK